MVLSTESVVIDTGDGPADVMISAMLDCLPTAKDHSL